MASLETIGGIHYEMMKRCYNENSIMYSSYGAKGITVCEEWHDRNNFKKWAYENGYKTGLRLERVDGNKNYEPDNCYFGEKSKKKSDKNKHTKDVRIHRKEIKEKCGVKTGYSKTRIYRIYCKMIRRCKNEKDKDYKFYGEKGIDVCERWSMKDGFFYFYKWSMENGYRDKLSIDRIDVKGNYCPENCRWVDMETQANNRSNNIYVEYNGERMTISQIEKKTGLKRNEIQKRLNNI